MHPIKRLLLTVGLPRSGKTTWAMEQRGVPVVCPDAIRYALHGQRFQALAEPFVWAIALVMVRALFAYHDTVIVDATHTTRKRREFWKSDEWDREYVTDFGDFALCMERALAEGDSTILPVIERMHEQWEPIGQDETP